MGSPATWAQITNKAAGSGHSGPASRCRRGKFQRSCASRMRFSTFWLVASLHFNSFEVLVYTWHTRRITRSHTPGRRWVSSHRDERRGWVAYWRMTENPHWRTKERDHPENPSELPRAFMFGLATFQKCKERWRGCSQGAVREGGPA